MWQCHCVNPEPYDMQDILWWWVAEDVTSESRVVIGIMGYGYSIGDNGAVVLRPFVAGECMREMITVSVWWRGIWCQHQASRWGHRSVITCIQLLFTYTLINISWRDRRTTEINWRSTMTYHQWDYPCWDLVYSVTLVLPPRHDFHSGDTERMWWDWRSDAAHWISTTTQ